jgi:chemotaxis response regulator CheB
MVKGAVKKEDVEKTNVQETPTFPIVALGSSAGGLEANEAFFKNAPRTREWHMWS